jgi:hypothetical protein
MTLSPILLPPDRVCLEEGDDRPPLLPRPDPPRGFVDDIMVMAVVVVVFVEFLRRCFSVSNLSNNTVKSLTLLVVLLLFTVQQARNR